MQLSALSIALQGLYGGLQAASIAVQGFMGLDVATLPGGTTKRRRIISVPGFTVNIPARPDPRRPRKRRHADILFLGQ